MCSGTPGKVLSIDGVMAQIESGDQHRWYNAMAQPELAIGDYVLVYADLVVKIISEQEAQEMSDMLVAMRAMQAELYQSLRQER